MIGDAVAAGKRKSTRAHGPEFKHKLAKGQAFKHIEGMRNSDGAGGKETKHSAKRAMKGHPNGVGVHDKQAPHKQKERKEVKHVDQGDILNEWVMGKRKHYR